MTLVKYLPALLVLSAVSTAVRAEDWAQAAANPARTAHVADEPKGPYKPAWVKHWTDEVMTNTSQPIIVAGVVYVGTTNGRAHAVRAADGKELWTADVGAPICHALASDGKRIFAAAFDGVIHALALRIP